MEGGTGGEREEGWEDYSNWPFPGCVCGETCTHSIYTLAFWRADSAPLLCVWPQECLPLSSCVPAAKGVIHSLTVLERLLSSRALTA